MTNLVIWAKKEVVVNHYTIYHIIEYYIYRNIQG
jgi:hypothetical protein